MNFNEKNEAYENQAFRRHSRELEESEQVSHCTFCGLPCGIIHDLEMSACCYAGITFKEEE